MACLWGYSISFPLLSKLATLKQPAFITLHTGGQKSRKCPTLQNQRHWQKGFFFLEVQGDSPYFSFSSSLFMSITVPLAVLRTFRSPGLPYFHWLYHAIHANPSTRDNLDCQPCSTCSRKASVLYNSIFTVSGNYSLNILGQFVRKATPNLQE